MGDGDMIGSRGACLIANVACFLVQVLDDGEYEPLG
jgi:hypothetical protein